MLPISIMALFCEDIREEKNDIVTLIGILPDTVNVEAPPSESPAQITKLLSKLCIYVRINFDPTMELGTAQIWLAMPEGERLALGEIGSDIAEKSQQEATARGNLLAGVVSRVVLAGFQPPKGAVKVEVSVKGETHVAGAITFNPLR